MHFLNIIDHPVSGRRLTRFVATSVAVVLLGIHSNASATEPCQDFGECKVLVEINSTDGDIGFHWLADADDLGALRIDDADGNKVFENKAYGPLKEQHLTETFGESSEPLCSDALKEEDDDVVVTVEEFVRRWPDGQYDLTGRSDDGEKLSGSTRLTYYLPAAPENLTYMNGSAMVTWTPGSALGACATQEELANMVSAGILPEHPMNVPLAAWEVTLEVEDDSNLSFTVRLPVGQTGITLPLWFLDALESNTPAKIEVGAIGGNPVVDDNDNATFTESNICLNEIGDGCAEEEG